MQKHDILKDIEEIKDNSVAKDVFESHLAEMATTLGRIEFNCTPLTGYEIVGSKCYVINKVAYLEIGVKKIDGTTFTIGLTNLVTVPHFPTSDIVVLSSIGMTAGGTPLETKVTIIQRWNKTVGLNVAVANATTLYISGQYLID